MSGRFDMTPSPAFTTTTVAGAEKVTAFLRRVYGWMFVGLGITASVAFAVASSGAALQIARTPILYWGTFIGLFVVYSALNGATLSLILLLYTGASIASTFVVTAAMFGALALFGTVTKRSLAGVGQFAFMGLIGVILASVVGMFWHSSGLQFGISIVGVIVFTALTAWDAQRLKQWATALPDGQTGSYAVVGALSLYLDFINLFLFMLRFMGGRRN